MTTRSLRILAVAASLLTAGYVAGQANAGKPAAAAKPQKLVRVATLNSVQANREFQTNVQLVQAQRQAAVELNAAVEKESNAAKKKELKKKYDELVARLTENNAKMQKIYGFSLTRNYTLEIETAHIYMLVSDDEAAKIEKGQAGKSKFRAAAVFASAGPGVF